MEIQEGPRGPLFLVTSTEGDSATGQTPDIAWKNLQKKAGAKVRNWQRRRSFPQKIDGAELFGFKNASVQRLLRELIVDSTGSVVQNLPCPVVSDAASLSTNEDAADAEHLPVCLDKKDGTAKRTMNPSQVEGTAKRVHYQDILTSVDNCSESSQGSANKGGPASITRPQDEDVAGSRSLLPLLDEVHDNSKYTSVDDNLGVLPLSSSQQVGLSSGSSYVSSEKSDIESAEKEVAMSMMSILLPLAIPFLERSKKKKMAKRKKKEENTVLVRTASAHNPSDDDQQGVTGPTAIGKGMDINSSEMHVRGGSHCDMVNDGCTNDGSVFKLDMMNAVVADSFEDDAQICGDKPKSVGFQHYESDDVSSREPNENSKVLYDKFEHHTEPFKCPTIEDITKAPDVVYDHERGEYILSDSLLACLEEEFGGEDIPYPANSNGNTMLSVGRESNVCERNILHHQLDHAVSSTNKEGLVSAYTKPPVRGLDHHLELVGCYQHPMPVLSIMLNAKHHSSLHICVLSGFLESCQRFLHVYTTTSEEQQDTPPCFVGYSSLLLPSLEQSSAGDSLFGKSGMQFTPDGQFLVLLSSIKIPFCRIQSIDCLCPVCKLNQCEDNSLKIVSVNFGYVSLLSKLMPRGTVSCILVCEPNYIIAAEDSRNLHIWKMVFGWSGISEEYVIPSLDNVGPSIVELRILSEGCSLIIGHDGAGGFCLWDIHKATVLATFAAPGNIVFKILPVGVCSLQEDIMGAPVDDIEKRLRDITVSDMPSKNRRIMASPREDIAVWVLVSSASVAEYQHDLRAKEYNPRWRLALLAKKRVFLGRILDPRATAVDASGNYGFAGTYGGLLYTWELSSGRKVADTQCVNGGRVSCIAVDAKSGVLAVADGGCQLLLYTQKGAKRCR